MPTQRLSTQVRGRRHGGAALRASTEARGLSPYQIRSLDLGYDRQKVSPRKCSRPAAFL